jgi:hypothetical protein
VLVVQSLHKPRRKIPAALESGQGRPRSGIIARRAPTKSDTSITFFELTNVARARRPNAFCVHEVAHKSCAVAAAAFCAAADRCCHSAQKRNRGDLCARNAATVMAPKLGERHNERGSAGGITAANGAQLGARYETTCGIPSRNPDSTERIGQPPPVSCFR